MAKLGDRAVDGESMSDAILEADAGGQGEAALIGGTPMVASQADLDRLAAGVGFTYLHDRAPPGGWRRIVTVPVN